MTEELESPMPGQLLAYAANLNSYQPGDNPGGESIITDINYANLLTSASAERFGRHKVVVDIDMPAKLIPSSTPNHYHLLIDHEMSAEDYFKLLTVMAEVGLIEKGYLGASEMRGYSSVRLPWVKKRDAHPL